MTDLLMNQPRELLGECSVIDGVPVTYSLHTQILLALVCDEGGAELFGVCVHIFIKLTVYLQFSMELPR